MQTIEARVVKCLSNKFIVDVLEQSAVSRSSESIKNSRIICYARGKMKKDADIVTGDFVTLQKVGGDYILDSAHARKNVLIRPSVANIDQLVIVVAPIPEVDFTLLDKLVINAHKQCLDVVICVNKNDMDCKALFNKIISQYSQEVNNIISVSASSGDLAALLPLLQGNLSCMAGQSAVGKSSIINMLSGLNRAVGELSEHNSKGKNTTTNVELIKLEDNTYIVDSPGFSMLDIHNIKCEELAVYYDEFLQYAKSCRFKMCSHTVEPDCALKQAVINNLINKERYERYCIMYAELKNAPKDYE